NRSGVPALADQYGVTQEATDLPGVFRFTGSSAALAQLQLALQASPATLYAEFSQTMTIQQVPNDPRFADNTQWDLNGPFGIQAPGAWDTTVGSTHVPVGVIDTGIDYTHPDLYLNIWVNQGEIPAAVRAAIMSNPSWDVDGDGLITFWDLNDPRDQG